MTGTEYIRLVGDEEAHGGDGFAPVPALEEQEGDDTIPRREHVKAHGAVRLEHPLFLQLPAAGEHPAHAQDRDDEVCRQHSATFVATRSLREPSLSAARARSSASASIVSANAARAKAPAYICLAASDRVA